MDKDKLTTLMGVGGGLTQIVQVDWSKIAHGDPGEIGKAAFAVVFLIMGWATNKQ